LEPPFVFKKAGLRRLPEFSVLVDDIPQGLTLNKSEQYIVDFLEGLNRFTNIKVDHHKLIHLSDGTKANYYEISMNYGRYDLVIAGVNGYKNKKLIAVFVNSTVRTPLEYLRSMVTSLKLGLAKP